MSQLQLPPLPPRAVGAIWAQASDGVIGRGGDMPWHAPEDMAHFKATTWGHPVVMGRRTWESIPPRFRPFPGRSNLVLTGDSARAAELAEQGATAHASLTEALADAATHEGGELTWITGGGALYAQAIHELVPDLLVVTVLDLEVPDGDTLAPEIPSEYELASASPSPTTFHNSPAGPGYRFEVWTRKARA
ncbi:MAG: dihydrofolate reductase [Arthrobacter sp.]|jgi:dihydrofolate reductase|nr:dihydrofolate reductase [Arthrobacter sp.]